VSFWAWVGYLELLSIRLLITRRSLDQEKNAKDLIGPAGLIVQLFIINNYDSSTQSYVFEMWGNFGYVTPNAW